MIYFLVVYGVIMTCVALHLKYLNYMIGEEIERSRLLTSKAKDLVTKAYESQKTFNEMLDRHYGK